MLTIGESDGSIRVCTILIGQIERNVLVTYTTQNGSAEGGLTCIGNLVALSKLNGIVMPTLLQLVMTILQCVENYSFNQKYLTNPCVLIFQSSTMKPLKLMNFFGSY